MQPGGDDLNHSEDLQKEIENLRERLSRLSRASLRIAGGLDPDAVLQETVDGARSLTGARYGVLAVLDCGGQVLGLGGVVPVGESAMNLSSTCRSPATVSTAESHPCARPRMSKINSRARVLNSGGQCGS